MKLKMSILAVIAGSAALTAAPAFADNGWHDGHSWRHHRHHYAPPVVYVPAPRVYYTPAPVYYAPPQAVYPVPVYYSAPVYRRAPQPGVSIRLSLPL